MCCYRLPRVFFRHGRLQNVVTLHPTPMAVDVLALWDHRSKRPVWTRSEQSTKSLWTSSAGISKPSKTFKMSAGKMRCTPRTYKSTSSREEESARSKNPSAAGVQGAPRGVEGFARSRLWVQQKRYDNCLCPTGRRRRREVSFEAHAMAVSHKTWAWQRLACQTTRQIRSFPEPPLVQRHIGGLNALALPCLALNCRNLT